MLTKALLERLQALPGKETEPQIEKVDLLASKIPA
jgi:hypothetical protein